MRNQENEYWALAGRVVWPKAARTEMGELGIRVEVELL